MDYELMQGDCLVEMDRIADGSIDAIICDLPYQVTACDWDIVIPFDALWKQFKRVIKPRGAIALFGTEPFSSLLRTSNLPWYKYDWVWDKKLPGNFADAKYRPLRTTEQISIFSKETTNYYPKMRKGAMRFKGGQKQDQSTMQPGFKSEKKLSDMYFPNCVLTFPNTDRSNGLHPTQKPLDLVSYLVTTYTQPGNTVLDATMGSGTTIVAALQNKRRGIGIEKDANYFQIAKRRIEDAARAAAGQPKILQGSANDISGLPMFAEIV